MTGDIYSGVSSVSDWTFPVPLPAWLPWHPPTVQRGYIILAPLPPTARAAVLHFGAPGGPPGPGAGETVHVPLGPHATALSTDCATAAHALRCAITLVFPLQPSGTRLTLTIRAVQLGNPFAPTTQHPLPGPWRLPATVP